MAHYNTVFSQLLKLIPRHEFETLAKQHHSGRSFRSASRWSQFVTMAMGQLSGRNSLRDIIESTSAQAHLLYHLGSARLSRSNLSRINENLMRCMKRNSGNYTHVAREWRQGGITSVLKIHFILWMHQRLTCVYPFSPGRNSVQPKVQLNYTWA